MAPVYTITHTHIELKFSGYYKYIDYDSKINREHKNEKLNPNGMLLNIITLNQLLKYMIISLLKYI